MASLIDQLKTVVEEGAAARKDLNRVGDKAIQTAQVAYSLNCIWLYAQDTNPTRETLAAALPPVPTGSPETTCEAIEYIRRTLIIIRSLVSEKIEESVRVKADLSQFQAILTTASREEEPRPRIEQIDEEETEEIIQEIVPLAIRPAPLADKPASRNKARKQRPWLLT